MSGTKDVTYNLGTTGLIVSVAVEICRPHSLHGQRRECKYTTEKITFDTYGYYSVGQVKQHSQRLERTITQREKLDLIGVLSLSHPITHWHGTLLHRNRQSHSPGYRRAQPKN
jgi:hypothetical protein